MKKKKPQQNPYSVCVIRTTTMRIVVEVKASNEAEAEEFAMDEAESSKNEDKWTYSESLDTYAVLKA